MPDKKEQIKKILEILQGDKPKAETLKELLTMVNDGITREEFIKSFQTAFNQVLQIEVKALEKVNKAIYDLNSQNNTSLEALQDDLKRFQEEVGQSINSALKEQENSLNFIRDKVRNLKDGEDGQDGKDADETKIIQEVLKLIPDYEEKIKKLENEIEELRQIKPLKEGRGGVSAMGVAQAFKWILKTETPVGLINGVNTEYTVSQTIFAVLAFSLNGEVICQLPNYTISKNKIIFSTALPADYAGKDFEIKYV